MVAFRSILRPVQLANGTWYEMQQQREPWQGVWIFMTQWGRLQIKVDGLDSKAVIQEFAGSLMLVGSPAL
jgi:hypothetical protein